MGAQVVPVANFSVSPTTGNAPLTVSFNDSSLNGPTAWSWDFGDGIKSDQKNTTHTYNVSGNYTVSLTATNSKGSNTTRYVDQIVVHHTPPVASFTVNSKIGTMPLIVSFNDTSINDPASWAWDFGDGSKSTEQNPIHTYATAGTFTVSLTVANDGGSNTRTSKDFITVRHMPPVAAFSVNRLTSPTGYPPFQQSFSDDSLNDPTSWAWDFGDGSKSTEENPTHTYDSSGTYSVSLTVTNDGGSNTTTKTNLIKLSPRYFETGTYLKNNLYGGDGTLEISNGLSEDAIIIMTRTTSPRNAVVSVYVRGYYTYTINGIPDGDYNIYYMTGTDWDSANGKFTHPGAYKKFEDVFDYVTTSSEYTTWEIGIKPVVGGNAHTDYVSPSSFPV